MAQTGGCSCLAQISSGIRIRKFGYYRRQSDGAVVQRYRCSNCHGTYSEATNEDCYRQKKRQFNLKIFEKLVSGVSQRRCARLLRINRKTVVRKFILLGVQSHAVLTKLNSFYPAAKTVEFDDMETAEHSKCKPLSNTLMVESYTRRIMGFRVASMPAKGPLAAIALKKYGPRKDDRKKARISLFSELKPHITLDATIKSDMNPHYGPDVREHFPKALHVTFKGRRGCVVGQGELKRGGFDPLFSLNHTCAMLRANINRLFRRTWCTTKLRERLGYHIAMYALYHNLVLLQKPRSRRVKPI